MRKKNIIQCITIFLMASFLFGCSSDSRPKYKNRAYNILIRYPQDWEPKEYVNETVVVFLSPLEEGVEAFQENVSISVQDIPEDATLDDYTKVVLAQIKLMGDIPNVYLNILESAPKKIAKRHGHKIVYTLTEYAYPEESVKAGLTPELDEVGFCVQIMMAWAIKDQRAYIFVYTSTNDAYETFLPEVDDMLKSFRIL